jgi:hypothetical protein
MALTTESTLRTYIANRIKGIYLTLGFDAVNGNVHEYLLQYERKEKGLAYLRALISGAYQVRAWGVSVLSKDEPYATRGVIQRTFDIKIQGYYECTPEGYNKLAEGCRLVTENLMQSSCMGGLVRQLISIDTSEISELVNTDNEYGKILYNTINLIVITHGTY